MHGIGTHDTMVPFWRRRLLAVTMPAVLLVAGVLLAAFASGIEYIRYMVIMRGESVIQPMWLKMMTAWAMLTPFLLGTILPVGRPAPLRTKGTGYWVSRISSSLRTTLCLLPIAYIVLGQLAVILGVFWISLAASAVASLGFGFALPLGTGRHVPRERALSVAEGRFAILAASLLAITTPAALILTRTWDPINEQIDRDSQTVLAAITLYSCAITLIASLVALWFTKQLTIRHAHFHATHCHDCGYNLTTLETDTCPECGLAIRPDQRDAIASLAASESASNGSQSTSSSPT